MTASQQARGFLMRGDVVWCGIPPDRQILTTIGNLDVIFSVGGEDLRTSYDLTIPIEKGPEADRSVIRSGGMERPHF